MTTPPTTPAEGGEQPRLPLLADYPASPKLYYNNKKLSSPVARLALRLAAETPGKLFIAMQRPLPAGVPLSADPRHPLVGVLCRLNRTTTTKGDDDEFSWVGIRRVHVLISELKPVPIGIHSEIPDGPAVPESAIAAAKQLFAAWAMGRKLDGVQERVSDETDAAMIAYSIANGAGSTVRGDVIEAATDAERLDIACNWLRDELKGDAERLLLHRLDSLPLSAEARQKVDVEAGRLRQLGPTAGERGHILSVLQSIADLPWIDDEVPAALQLATAREVLDRDHAGMLKVKRKLTEFLSALLWWEMRHDGDSPPPSFGNLLLVGPPGTGKTTLLKAIAEIMGQQLEIVPCGGISDITTLNGSESHWIGARSGAIIGAVQRAGTRHMVLALDEIDKMGNGGQRGDPHSVLLELTDPAQNSHFVDRYLNFGFDLSPLTVIATANSIECLPAPVLDRFEIIDLRGYSASEKVTMAHSHIIPRLTQQLLLTDEITSFGDDSLEYVVNTYSFESGVRRFTQHLTTLFRRRIEQLLSGDVVQPITREEIRRELGTPPMLDDDVTRLSGTPGCVPVLGVTAETRCGVVYGLQARFTDRQRYRCNVTGSVGQTIADMASVAVTWVETNGASLGIDRSKLAEHSIHLHHDRVDIPKSGGSAGIAGMAAIASLALDRPVPEATVMTGEITLDGRVLPVAGIEEKCIAAQRAGAREMVLPTANLGDLDDLPADVRDALVFHPVERIEDALRILFPRSAGEGEPFFEPPIQVVASGTWNPDGPESEAV